MGMVVTTRPQWIAKMYPTKRGRDHLGLGSVSMDQILPSLSPGINVLTIHPRYHSFYVFLLDEFWQRDRPRSYRQWVMFFRPRELIFSIAANLCDQPEHGIMGGIVGSDKTEGLADQQQPSYETSVNYIKSPLGGYGLYYRSVMAELGLVYPGGRGLPYPVDVPTERGKLLAKAFRRAVASTVYYREYFDHDHAEVPLDSVREYGRAACLCQLQKKTAPDTSLLLDHFLHRGLEPEARLATLRMMLDVAAQTDGNPVGEDDFRQLLYFGITESGITYSPQDDIRDTYSKWRLYQAREYYSFALNALWCYLSDWGLRHSGDIRPIPIAQFWEHLKGVLDWGSVAEMFGVPGAAPSPQSPIPDLLAWLRRPLRPGEGRFDDQCTTGNPIHEHKLYRVIRSSLGRDRRTPALALSMLGLIHLRFGQPERWLREEWAISRMGGDDRLSLHGFLVALRDQLTINRTALFDLAEWLYSDYVILQHQLVATRKLPDNTFRFRREGDRLRFFNVGNGLRFMSSRFQALSTTVHELGLCGDLSLSSHPLSSKGQRLLSEGDLL